MSWAGEDEHPADKTAPAISIAAQADQPRTLIAVERARPTVIKVCSRYPRAPTSVVEVVQSSKPASTHGWKGIPLEDALGPLHLPDVADNLFHVIG